MTNTELLNNQQADLTQNRSQNDLPISIYSQAITGGDRQDNQLQPQIKLALNRATSIDIIVSFLMESGVRSLISDLRSAIDRGVKIRILTGNYLGITQPSALWLLHREFKNKLSLRFYKEEKRSFHAKAYIFHYGNLSAEDTYTEIFIGSSNLSKSALTNAIEWNYRFSSCQDPISVESFQNSFNNLYTDDFSKIIDEEVLTEYSRGWHCPLVLKDWQTRQDLTGNIVQLDSVEPIGVQLEALCALDKAREEGSTKALIVVATGVGKTYLAGFDCADTTKFKRVLFIAHRDEILHQAQSTFTKIRKSNNKGYYDTGFFNSTEKNTTASMIFASIQTLSQEKDGASLYLRDDYFKRDHFDYIIIDEFHHAAAPIYKRIFEYFTPKFLLGLTATPDRLDGKTIYALCDHNVAYRLDLFEAINKALLVPFHYYAVYDYIVDYTVVPIKNGHYQEEELERQLITNARSQLIIKYYNKYPSQMALAFCCSQKHALETAKAMQRAHIKATAVISNQNNENYNISKEELAKLSMPREEAVKALNSNQINVICVVDMFNEGIDIPGIDLILMLRPTESPIVFLQQLGRGLRLDRRNPSKQYLNVIDFIGNYKKAGLSFSLLTNNQNLSNGSNPIKHHQYPDGCLVDADIKVIDLLAHMRKNQYCTKDKLINEYYRIKHDINNNLPPSRLQYLQEIDEEIFSSPQNMNKLLPTKSWLEFRAQEINDLSPKEKEFINHPCYPILAELQRENMTLSYKIPLLLSFVEKTAFGTKLRSRVSLEQMCDSFVSFYANSFYQQDLCHNKKLKEKCQHYEELMKASDFKQLIKNYPLKYICSSKDKKLFERLEDNLEFTIAIKPMLSNPIFIREFIDIVQALSFNYFRNRYQQCTKKP